MNTNNQIQTESIRAGDFLSPYFIKEDFEREEATLTIRKLEVQEFEGKRKPSLVAGFSETRKLLVLNKTNIQTLVSMLGSDDTAEWVGRAITLRLDPDISFGGRKVGGIRVANN